MVAFERNLYANLVFFKSYLLIISFIPSSLVVLLFIRLVGPRPKWIYLRNFLINTQIFKEKVKTTKFYYTKLFHRDSQYLWLYTSNYCSLLYLPCLICDIVFSLKYFNEMRKKWTWHELWVMGDWMQLLCVINSSRFYFSI